jgi:hypothetical protein
VHASLGCPAAQCRKEGEAIEGQGEYAARWEGRGVCGRQCVLVALAGTGSIFLGMGGVQARKGTGCAWRSVRKRESVK